MTNIIEPIRSHKRTAVDGGDDGGDGGDGGRLALSAARPINHGHAVLAHIALGFVAARLNPTYQ